MKWTESKAFPYLLIFFIYPAIGSCLLLLQKLIFNRLYRCFITCVCSSCAIFPGGARMAGHQFMSFNFNIYLSNIQYFWINFSQRLKIERLLRATCWYARLRINQRDPVIDSSLNVKAQLLGPYYEQSLKKNEEFSTWIKLRSMIGYRMAWNQNKGRRFFLLWKAFPLHSVHDNFISDLDLLILIFGPNFNSDSYLIIKLSLSCQCRH